MISEASGRHPATDSEALDTAAQHRAAAGDAAVPCAVVTLSDTRTQATDLSGRYLADAIVKAGHRLVGSRLIRDEPDALLEAVDALIGDGALLVLCTGGTGIGPRDRTVETLEPLWERRLPGFGELMRVLSFEQVGAAAMLSRAGAGIYRDAVLFALPGSTAAVELAWTRLILPEIQHMAHLLRPS